MVQSVSKKISQADPPTRTNQIETGMENAIQPIVADLSKLAWLSKVFGRAKIIREEQLNVPQDVPKIYSGFGEYYNLLPVSDMYPAYCFFLGRDTEEITEETQLFIHPQFNKTVDLIVSANLFAVDPGRDYDYTTDLERSIIGVLRNHNARIIEVVDEIPSDVWEGMSLDAVDQDRLHYPWTSFRVRFQLSFTDCIKPLTIDMSQQVNFELTIGDTFGPHTIRFTKEDDPAFDWTGTTVKIEGQDENKKYVFTDEPVLDTSTPGEATFTWELSADQTKNFTGRIINYDMEARFPSGGVKTVLRGIINLIQDVTRP